MNGACGTSLAPPNAPEFFEIRPNGDGRFVVAGWNGATALEPLTFPSFHPAYRTCRAWVDRNHIDVRFR